MAISVTERRRSTDHGHANYGRVGNGETSEVTLCFDAVEILPGEVFDEKSVIYEWVMDARIAVDMYAMEQIPTYMEGERA